MAVSLFGSLNKVINRTASEILDDQVISKVTGVVTTFLNSGVEVIRDITEQEEDGDSETEEDEE